MHTHIIYIPGLGGRYNKYRRIALKSWALYGVTAELVPIDWYDTQDFDQKMKLVNQVIASHGQHRVVVIGESAGATLALQAAKNPHVHRVITLCGVAQSTMPVAPHLQRDAPALLQATRSIPDTKQYDVHSVRAFRDQVVNEKYTIATGAHSYIIWLMGHLLTIVACMTILTPVMLTIAKKSRT